MRHRLNNALKRRFRDGLIKERDRLGLTQEQMAERFEMSNYGYSKLERGKSGCGGLTLSMYLTDSCEDREKFIEELKEDFDKIREGSYVRL